MWKIHTYCNITVFLVPELSHKWLTVIAKALSLSLSLTIYIYIYIYIYIFLVARGTRLRVERSIVQVSWKIYLITLSCSWLYLAFTVQKHSHFIFLLSLSLFLFHFFSDEGYASSKLSKILIIFKADRWFCCACLQVTSLQALKKMTLTLPYTSCPLG